jgi:hypothetical protein
MNNTKLADEIEAVRASMTDEQRAALMRKVEEMLAVMSRKPVLTW